jgi:putative ABC transport system substrate-binding protein
LGLLSLILSILTGLLLAACGSGTRLQEIVTIGAINYDETLDPVLAGFKAGLAELGHVEGENITYIYNGALEPDPQVIEREIESLLAREVDMLFTMGTPTTLAAKQAVADMDIPIIFAPVFDPVGAGIVESLRQPGGHLTGVQSSSTIPKSLEWLLNLTPATTIVYVPFHPDDEVSGVAIVPLREAAATLGVELILDEVHTPQEAMSAIETLPWEGSAVFFVPAPSLEVGISDIIKCATDRNIAVGSYLLNHVEEKGALVNYLSLEYKDR